MNGSVSEEEENVEFLKLKNNKASGPDLSIIYKRYKGHFIASMGQVVVQ